MAGKDNPLYSRDCKKCSCPLAFVKTPKGETQVLDLRAPVYVVMETGGRREAVRHMEAFASHFSTCPKANEF